MNTIDSYFQHYLCVKERENFPNGFIDLPHRLKEAYKAGFELGKATHQQNNDDIFPITGRDVIVTLRIK